MSRSVIVVLIALTTLAGCIQPPEETSAETFEPANAPPDAERIDGMTAAETHEDQIVPCPDHGDPLLDLPRACAQRGLNVTGRIGLDILPVELISDSGMVVIEHSEGDAWSLSAVIRTEALTEDLAMQALDTAWTWSHEDATGEHALRAGPTATGGAVVTMGVSPTAAVTYSEVRLTLPEWLTLEIRAATDNGQIVVDGFDMRSADLSTDNGQIVVAGSVGALRLQTDNGGVTAALTPRESAAWEMTTDNGQIVITMPEGVRYGYDVDAKVDNGQVVIGLMDGETTQGEGTVRFQTTRYADRAVQIKIGAQVDNGQIVLGSG